MTDNIPFLKIRFFKEQCVQREKRPKADPNKVVSG